MTLLIKLKRKYFAQGLGIIGLILFLVLIPKHSSAYEPDKQKIF